MLAGLLATLLQPELPPAFLDGPSRVTVWFSEPRKVEDLRSAELRNFTDDESLSVSSVAPVGPPARVGPVDPDRLVIAGSFQDEIGGFEWNPNSDRTLMTRAGDLFELVVELPGGAYEYKLAQGGSWERNWGVDFQPGGVNVPLVVPEGGAVVRFVASVEEGVLLDSINHPDEVSAPDEAPEVFIDATLFRAFELSLEGEVAIGDVTDEFGLVLPDSQWVRDVEPREFLSDPAFVYGGDDLGSRWSAEGTWFKVWSPTADAARLRLYGEEDAVTEVPMRRGTAGVWYAYVPGEHHGQVYRYAFEQDGEVRLAADINAYAATQDLLKSIVVDLDRTDPEGWPGPVNRLENPTDAVIYEIHVRDLTIDPASGVPEELRGTYSGLATSGTTTPGGNPSALDYLVWLGVTDVHLLPIQSFMFDQYSWGYATTLFNVPEETYSTTPDDPMGTIRQTKAMIRDMQEAGLRVVLDVVYNHTWPPEGLDSAFEQTQPHYYFRTDEAGRLLNESGVGNAMADERPMARKFVRDSLLYWLREYQVDGYRFDLLGMHRPESVRDWVAAMREVRPDVTLYGEPWTGGGPLYFGKEQQRGTTMGLFNDRIRGAFRGSTRGEDGGFAMGATVGRDLLASTVRASLGGAPHGFTDDPRETINYVSAHDDLTLHDKIETAVPSVSESDRRAMARLATAAVVLAQGIPFLEGGVELGRTKGGDPNSYDSGDAVNQFDWTRADAYWSDAEALRDLIALRKRHPALRMAEAEEIQRRVDVWDVDRTGAQTLVWEIDASDMGDPANRILVALNGSSVSSTILLPDGEWSFAYGGEGSAVGALSLDPWSVSVFAR